MTTDTRIPMFQTNPLYDATAVAKVMRSGMLGEGPVVSLFTDRLKQLFRHDGVLCVNSCTSALILALRAAGVKYGDSVVSSPFTMIATNTAIRAVGAHPVWADVDPDTFCINLDDAYLAARDDTRAIVVTCVGGIVPFGLSDYPGKHPLILDCAHALTTEYQGTHISDWGDFSCFSFQSIKHLTTGDGGAITCNQSYERVEKLKWFGMTRKVPDNKSRLQHQMTSDVTDWGYKFHMNDISAAIGLSNFDFAINEAVASSVDNARYYMNELASLDGIQLPHPPDGCYPSWWVFGFLADQRDRLIAYLDKRGIEATPLWRRNDEYTCFHASKTTRDLPGMDIIAKHAVFIPSGYWVQDYERDKIVRTIKRFYKG